MKIIKNKEKREEKVEKEDKKRIAFEAILIYYFLITSIRSKYM